jgi:cyclopropane fatty-acyl-phospholipid synthase-like methyltransferase
MNQMSLHDFERRYREQADPWGYETSAYERAKYDATILACGPGPHECALELGSSIGVLSQRLAPTCRRLVTIDGAPTAIRAARARLAGSGSGVEVLQGRIPDDVPAGPYDLVVASEILYYLDEEALRQTFALLRRQMEPDARLVAVHWRRPGPERPFTAAEIHGYLRETPWLSPLARGDTDDYLLDVAIRR